MIIVFINIIFIFILIHIQRCYFMLVAFFVSMFPLLFFQQNWEMPSFPGPRPNPQHVHLCSLSLSIHRFPLMFVNFQKLQCSVYVSGLKSSKLALNPQHVCRSPLLSLNFDLFTDVHRCSFSLILLLILLFSIFI